MSDAKHAFDDITALLAVIANTEPRDLTPRQQTALKGGEACIMLAAHPGKLDLKELSTLAQAGLIFGAVLAGER